MTLSSMRDGELGEPYTRSSIGVPPEIEALTLRKRATYAFLDPLANPGARAGSPDEWD